MASEAIFESSVEPGESYFLADDGQLFSLSQADPLSAEAQLAGLREIPLAAGHVGAAHIHQIEDITIIQQKSQVSQIVQAQHEQQELRQHQQLEEINSHQQQIYPLSNQQVIKKDQSVEDFMIVYTIYKCKACEFACGEKEVLFTHVRTTHLNQSTIPSMKQVTDEGRVHDVDDGGGGEGRDIDNMLIIEDLPEEKLTIEKAEEQTVILDENQPTTDKSATHTYFKFFLVGDKKEIYICTRCSICLASEHKMKLHVESDVCFESKCKNCGHRFNTEAELKLHTMKCKVAVFKLRKKRRVVEEAKDPPPPSAPVVEDKQQVLSTGQRNLPGNDQGSFPSNDQKILPGNNQNLPGNGQTMTVIEAKARMMSPLPETPETTSLVDKLYQKIEVVPDVDDDKAVSEQYKINRLTKNRTELEIDGAKRVWVCSLKNCYAIFKEESMLDYHARCHAQHDGFKCLECGKDFTRWQDLSYHLYKIHDKEIDLYVCIQCLEYKAPSVSILEKHCQTHANLRLYECDICHKSFNQYVQLKNHSVVHLKENMVVEVPNWAKPKTCDICKKVLSDSKALKKHVQAVHSKLKPYICQICGYKSSRKGNLRQHVRQHSGEKPYACDACDYRTGDLNTLRKHKRRHTGEKPYKCSLCPFSAIQSSNYVAHLKFKHHVTKDGKPVEGAKRKRSIVLPKTNILPKPFEMSSSADKSVSHAVMLTTDKGERDLDLSDSLDTLLAMDRAAVNLLQQND